MQMLAQEQQDHYYFMDAALVEAQKAMACDEVPVGAVIVHQGSIIARGYNQKELLRDPTAHAEMIAITSAAAYLQRWRLSETILYVTLEPCAMCAGAIVLARIDKLVYATPDPKSGACHSLYQIVQDPRLNHRTEVIAGIRAEQARRLLQTFFQQKRQRKI